MGTVHAPPAPTEPEGPLSAPRRTAGRWAWLGVRVALLVGLGYLATEYFISNSAELSGAASFLAGAHWDWIAAAAAAEAVSFLAFAQLPRRLLIAGGVRTGLGVMTAITVAANSLNVSLPGGGAFAAVFSYRQFRRRGADEALSAWTLVALTLLTALTLSLLAVAGLAIAGEDGPVAGLWPYIPFLLAIPAVLVVVLLRPRFLSVVAVPVLTWLCRTVHIVRFDPVPVVHRFVERLEAVTPAMGDWIAGFGWALVNWLTDCLCLVLAFTAVGADVPWRGLLVAYGAAQVAANLPITPGGLGVVEGSLTVALVAFGGSTASTVAAVLLYRIMSFWVPVPLGWVSWGGLRVEARRHPIHEPGIIDEVEREAGER
jgi:uncharacterized membrane protein YbhN (UPF0104 family)